MEYVDNHIYNASCMSYLDMFESEGKEADLIILDPPYNMGKASWDSFENGEGFWSFTCKYLDRIRDVLHPQGSVYLFNTPYNCALILEHLENVGMRFQNWLTWDKRDGQGGSKKRWAKRQESILFFSASKEFTFNADAVRIPYESTERIAHAAKKGIIKNGKRWFPNPDGRLCGDVWHITSDRHKNKIKGRTQNSKHPTPKPLDLIDRMIRASSNEGDLVMDFFMGTGTTALSALANGRRYTGCDSNPEYVDIARERINSMPSMLV